jgi:hypothetical protein
MILTISKIYCEEMRQDNKSEYSDIDDNCRSCESNEHMQLKWSAARGTAVSKIATHLQNAEYVSRLSIMSTRTETKATALLNGIWGRSIFQAFKFIQFYKQLREAGFPAWKMYGCHWNITFMCTEIPIRGIWTHIWAVNTESCVRKLYLEASLLQNQFPKR